MSTDMQEIEIPKPLGQLVEWYGDYSKEIVKDRAIVGIDGFKPSQRRILYAMKALEKVTDLTKSIAIAGSVLKLHPHGEASIYETMARMVDSSFYQNVPFLEGQGNFGAIYSTDPPAASRYTFAQFTKLSEELFQDMSGINMVPSPDTHYKEPDLLPTRFPNILCNATSGIAVGLASNVPSFNFHDVLKATIELIEKGFISEPLVPDFTSGGNYIRNDKELQKIMDTGRGRVKLRGKWFIEGKFIIIEQIPYYTTREAIKKKAEEIPGVSEVQNETDLEQGLRISIECTNKKVVDSVLTEVLRLTELQMSMMTNIVVIIDNKPRVVGVTELLKEWVKFRRRVLEKSYTAELEAVNYDIQKLELLIDFLGNDERRERFIKVLAEEGESNAFSVLREFYPTEQQDFLKTIMNMKIRQFTRVGENKTKLNKRLATKADLENRLADIDSVIVSQLKEINARYKFPRQTDVTTDDYDFDNFTKVTVKPEPVETLLVVDNKFVKKLRKAYTPANISGLTCKSDDIISFIDDTGRLLRLNLDNIEFTTPNERGAYLPVVLELEDDFEIVAYEVIEDKKIGYVYSDGYASVVDYSEWVNVKRITRMTELGVSPLASTMVAQFDFSKDYLLILTKEKLFGFAPVDFKQKNRTARTKLIPLKAGDEVETVVPLSYQDILTLVTSPERYMNKTSTLSYEDTMDYEYLDKLLS